MKYLQILYQIYWWQEGLQPQILTVGFSSSDYTGFLSLVRLYFVEWKSLSAKNQGM